MTQRCTVALLRQREYHPERVRETVSQLLDTIGFRPAPGAQVLVKPNLLQASPSGLVCTHPQVVRAACAYLRDCGAKPTVGDSPGFGSARAVAEKIGLIHALRGLDVALVHLDRPVRVRLPFGYSVGVARRALEADCILNIPKLKVHGQLRITAAVKNLFGCVVGTRKAIAHTRHGDIGNRFESLIVELMAALPPTVGLLDAVTAMHERGPVDGVPFPLGLLAASTSLPALDTAVYSLLGLDPDRVPLWRESLSRKLPGADAADLDFPLLCPREFDATGFITPKTLAPVTFHPLRLVKSALRRAWTRWF